MSVIVHSNTDMQSCIYEYYIMVKVDILVCGTTWHSVYRVWILAVVRSNESASREQHTAMQTYTYSMTLCRQSMPKLANTFLMNWLAIMVCSRIRWEQLWELASHFFQINAILALIRNVINVMQFQIAEEQLTKAIYFRLFHLTFSLMQSLFLCNVDKFSWNIFCVHLR